MKIHDVSHITYEVSSLDKTEKFMTDFGLKTVKREGNRLYMRAVDDRPYSYVAIEGAHPHLISTAFEVRNSQEFAEAAALPGASAVTAIDGPGGGQRVRVQAFENYVFDVVYGIEPVQPLATRRAFKINYASDAQRINDVVRIAKGPSDVMRFSHVALYVHDPAAATAWMQQNFGFLVSDYVEGPEDLFGSFSRADCGHELVDHHLVALVKHPRGEIHHSSFWVEDFDALFNGADWLTAQGHFHEHGIGRHGAGSQVFSYWRDPDGFLIERFTDGDVFDSTMATKHVEASPSAVFQWGPDPKPTFFE